MTEDTQERARMGRRVRAVVAAGAVASGAVVGAVLLALLPAAPAGADVAQVAVTCDLPAAGGLLGGDLIPDTIGQEVEVTLVDTPDPVLQGEDVTYEVVLPVPDLAGGLDLPPEYAPYGTLELNFVQLTVPLPAGLDTGAGDVSFDPAVPWLTVQQSGSNLVFRVESSVAGNSPTGRSPIRVDLDSEEPIPEVQQSAGVWVPVLPLPDVTLTGTATGAPGSSIDWKPPGLLTQVQYEKDDGLGGFLVDVDWDDEDVPCTPDTPTQTIASTAIADPGVEVALDAPAEAFLGQSVDHDLTITNTGDVPLTGVTVTSADVPGCAGAQADVPVGQDLLVECAATPGSVGTFSTDMTVETNETDPATTAATSTDVQLADLTVSASGPATVTEGDTIDYELEVVNAEAVTFTGLTVDDDLGSACLDAGADLAGGTVPPGTTELTCSYTTTGADVGTLGNVFTVDTAETDPIDAELVEVEVEAAPPPCLPPQFPDVPEDHPFFEEICWMAGTGVTTGFPDGGFHPAGNVTRQSMAAFLFRLSGDAEPTGCTQDFPDVATDHPFFEEICWMVGEGITTGYGDGTFKPASPVTRAAMAAFLYRYSDEPEFEAPGVPSFNDVALDHPFFHEIEWMADTGVTGGYPDGGFHPAGGITRQAMAAFLYRLTNPA